MRSFPMVALALVAATATAIACAQPAATAIDRTGPTVSTAPRGREGPAAAESRGLVIRIVNEEPDTYRVWYWFDGTDYPLGSVPGFETREFTIAHGAAFGAARLHLMVSTREARDARTSEDFSIADAYVVSWSLNAARARYVTVR